eukprot:5484635-Amphidinium_carterae.1
MLWFFRGSALSVANSGSDLGVAFRGCRVFLACRNGLSQECHLSEVVLRRNVLGHHVIFRRVAIVEQMALLSLDCCL